MINHDIIRIFNEVRISSFPFDIVINHDIIRILNDVRISPSPSAIMINHDIAYYRYSRTSLIRTPKGQSKVSVLERCPY